MYDGRRSVLDRLPALLCERGLARCDSRSPTLTNAIATVTLVKCCRVQFMRSVLTRIRSVRNGCRFGGFDKHLAHIRTVPEARTGGNAFGVATGSLMAVHWPYEEVSDGDDSETDEE